MDVIDGKYRILHTLGTGGFGVVYLADDLMLPPRQVALKMLNLQRELVSQEERNRLLLRFRQEMTNLARLNHPNHPNIVTIYASGEHDGKPYFVMEYVQGISLAKKLEGGPLEPQVTANLVRDLALAVQFAHDKGIVHRDIKPGNVLLGRDGVVKLLDFGLARWREDSTRLTQTGMAVGTPLYMSPEQVDGGEGDARSDVYTLGAVLYESLTGKPPFDGQSWLEVQRKIREEKPKPPSQLNTEVPLSLDNTCLKCLKKNPAHRYQTASGLAEDLRRYLEGEPVGAPPSVPSAQRRRISRGQPAPLPQQAWCFTGHWFWVNSVAFSTDGFYVLSSSYDNTMRLLDAATGEEVCSFDHSDDVEHAAFSPDGKYAISVSGAHLRLWDVATGARLGAPFGTRSEVTDWAAFSPDGHLIASCGDDRIQLWEVASMCRLHEFRDRNESTARSPSSVIKSFHETGEVHRCWFCASTPTTDGTAYEILTATPVYSGYHSAEWLPMGFGIVREFEYDLVRWRVLVAGNPGGSAATIKSVDELNRFTVRESRITDLQVSPAGSHALLAGTLSKVGLWDLCTGQELHRYRLDSDAKRVAFSPVSSIAVAACDDSVVRILDLGTPKVLYGFEGHTDEVTSARFSPDGHYVVSASRDKTVRCWRLPETIETKGGTTLICPC